MKGNEAKRGLACALAALVAVLAVGAGAQARGQAPSETAAGGPAPFEPGEVIVRFEQGGERVVDLPEGVGVGEAARALRRNPDVAYALPNYIARASAVPNDPGEAGAPGGWRESQWNFLPCGSLCGQTAKPLPFEAMGGINALGAWRIIHRRGRGSGRGARVAVLDTGVAYRHRRPRFRKSPDFLRRQFLRGFDFVANNRVPLDRDGHGTHVTGTIAELNNNGTALTGLAPGARIIPVRVLDQNGFGTASDIARGIRYAARRGADVINMSFEFSPTIRSCRQIRGICNAILFAARRHRAVLVAAAGNSNGNRVAFPARAPRVVGVGRTTIDGCAADFSRSGVGLDLMAPGGGLPKVADCLADGVFDKGNPILQLTFDGAGFRHFGYPRNYQGTSMAAAHVSGVAAMVISSRVLGRNPAGWRVVCQMMKTARRRNQLGQAYDRETFGAGLIDAARAVRRRARAC